jgi:lysine 6-dehydrogenase
MSHFLVMGAGKMGIVLANDLIESNAQNEVTLIDISDEHLKQASEIIQSDRLSPLRIDVEDEGQKKAIFEGKDVALCALLHKHSLPMLKAAVQQEVHFVDLVGEHPVERLNFDEEAKKKRLCLISGMGVSPGITNICVGRGAHLLDTVDRAMIYVGGNPVHPKPPLNYRIVYAVDSVLDFYERKVPVLKDGKIQELEPLSGIESISFPAPFTEMECFYTDGLNSLLYTMKGKIKNELAEKTIRHNGHAEQIKILKECGLFSREPIQLGGHHVIPRKVLEAVLDSALRLGEEGDATLLRIITEGKKSGRPEIHIFEMLDQYDSKKGYTSMAKTTSFPASIAAQMIASGQINQTGSLFPEDIFHDELYKPFIEELEKRGVVVTHEVKADS